MFSTDFIFRQQENLVDNQKCQAGFRPLCNKTLITHSKEFSGNQGKHQNFHPSILTYKFGLILIGMKQKKFFLKKIQNGQLKKKLRFSKEFPKNFRDRSLD